MRMKYDTINNMHKSNKYNVEKKKPRSMRMYYFIPFI